RSKSHKDKERITGTAIVTVVQNPVRLAKFYPRRSGQNGTVIPNLAAATYMQVQILPKITSFIHFPERLSIRGRI
ncbi:MAG: hypothetical protein LBH06_06005, partial [Rikenellaceae bacterium]|nr:hypothetical protein [Rikenellaceae bacterium]